MSAYISVLSFLLLLLPAGSTDRNIPTLNQTASPEAKAHFDKGLLLLHNFEYPDAAEEFILAQQKDPGFVLAYWGEAMTYDHPVWRDLDIDKSRTALKKFGDNPSDRLSKARTDLEKDFVQGVNILFGDGSKPDREKAYAEHMASLYQTYPDNHDVAAFYALSLLAIKKGWNEWEDYNVQAQQITRSILKKEPDHAGALHYLIHADDHPHHANDGLDAAKKYAIVASYAGHALHMPSHIYLALGMWDEEVKSNEVAWQASQDRVKRKNLSMDELSYHAHLWLEYGYLQQGRFQRAEELINNQVKYVEQSPSAAARLHLLQMKGHYLFTTNNWNSVLAALPVKADDLDAAFYFTSLFLDGYNLFQQSKGEELKKVISLLDKELAKAKQLQQEGEDIPVCGVTRYTNNRPTEQDIKTGTRCLNELNGLNAWLSKDMNAADGYFRSALPKEGSVVIGPPFFLISPYEVYGNFLMANNQYTEALQQFNKALHASPNRYIGLKGKLAAAKVLKDSAAEAEVKKQLQQNLKTADAAATQGLW